MKLADMDMNKAFEEYKKGNTDIEISVGFGKHKMLEEVKKSLEKLK